MASDDVIELGSSDEETEPAPKRKKPPPNAMVHIPGKLPSGITVTPSKNAKPRINPASIIKGSIGKAVTVTKITKTNLNPFATNNRLNGNPIKAPIMIRPVAGLKCNVQIPIQNNAKVPGLGLTIANAPKVINHIGKAVSKPSSRNVLNQAGRSNINIVKSTRPVPGKASALMKKQTLKHTTKLPPGITIKRTTAPSMGSITQIDLKKLNTPFTLVRMSNVGKVTKTPSSRGVIDQSLRCAEVPTVDLDDDEPATPPVLGPQWYLRPEDQTEKEQTEDDPQDPLADISTQDEADMDTEKEIPIKNSHKTSPEKSLPESEPSALENQNNKEPDKSNYIEITIEDSPIKPTKVKKGFKVGAELAITIEDSPIKNTTDKTDPSNSDDEENHHKDRNSKKKLEYPKTIKAVEVVEIEFEPLPIEESVTEKKSPSPKESESSPKSLPSKECTSSDKSVVISHSEHIEKPKRMIECIDIVEIEESPVKPIEEVMVTTPKKHKLTKPAYKMTQIETIDLEDKEKDEFSPIYRHFINLCFQLENSEDMKKIVEKKIKAYYLQVPKEYTESETFTDMVAGKIMAMKASPEKMYLYIKDVVDELNLQRKLAKAQLTNQKEEQEKFLYGEESEFDAKRQRQIRKLEKTLKKLHRAIQKLEEQEVDFDDEEDSVYLLTESEDDTSAKDGRPLNKEVLLQRYKERSVRVHAKLCQLTNTKMPSEARVQIDSRPGQPKGPAKRLEKWINRRVPIGTPLPFPDFHDVLRCVREANQEDKLGWNEADVMEEARDLFVRCGKRLQRRRQENEWRLAASRIPVDTLDPAEDSTELKRKLEENRRVASKKETEVFNKYADRQNLLKLEAVEIGDKEAEESPVESDDEELVEITDSLTDKEKRKKRLKRLLEEKSKVSDDKRNQPDNLSTENENSQKDATKDANDAGTSKDSKDDTKKDPIDTELSHKEPLNSDLSNKDGMNAVDSDQSNSKNKSDGNNVDSDIDELHLLEKLYSENEYNTNVGSSDTGSPIAISDTSSIHGKMSSDEKRSHKPSSGVISIENSSYSESEEKKEDSSKETEAEDITDEVVEETDNAYMEVECSVDTVEKTTNKNNNEEVNGLLEDILLASSDEADDSKSGKDIPVIETSINLRDDNISIGDTLIIENRDLDGDSEASKADNSDKNTITDGSSVEGMEIGPIEIHSEDQSRSDNIVETASVESLHDRNTNIANTKLPEANEERSSVEITNIDSVETIDDENENAETSEITSVKSSEGSNDGNGNETKVNSIQAVEGEKTTQSSEYVAVNEVLQDAANSVENINEGTTDKQTKNNTDFKTKDSAIRNSENTTTKEIQDIIQTTENTDKDSESGFDKNTKDTNDSMPEAMEVD